MSWLEDKNQVNSNIESNVYTKQIEIRTDRLSHIFWFI